MPGARWSLSALTYISENVFRMLSFINQFHTTGIFLYSLKNQKTSGFQMLSEVQNETSDMKWIKMGNLH